LMIRDPHWAPIFEIVLFVSTEEVY
jgi:hypothetical protein